jgi:hypothetical protein
MHKLLYQQTKKFNLIISTSFQINKTGLNKALARIRPKAHSKNGPDQIIALTSQQFGHLNLLN